jgi:hypothetical protein
MFVSVNPYKAFLEVAMVSRSSSAPVKQVPQLFCCFEQFELAAGLVEIKGGAAGLVEIEIVVVEMMFCVAIWFLNTELGSDSIACVMVPAVVNQGCSTLLDELK